MILKRIGVLSVGKIMGVIYAVIGVFVGGIFSLIAIVGSAAGRSNEFIPGFLAGAAAIVIAPILYGLMGFIGGIIMAALYNVFASLVGGVELELAPARSENFASSAPQA
jgi:hypothetical protein